MKLCLYALINSSPFANKPLQRTHVHLRLAVGSPIRPEIMMIARFITIYADKRTDAVKAWMFRPVMIQLLVAAAEAGAHRGVMADRRAMSFLTELADVTIP